MFLQDMFYDLGPSSFIASLNLQYKCFFYLKFEIALKYLNKIERNKKK